LHSSKKQEKRVLIAIDEFQQILNYPEKNMEARLRTIIQQLQNVVFIFSGSQPHLMSDMFANPAKPFYRSTSFLKLEKLDFEIYRQFILKKFTENNKAINLETIAEILNWTNIHTYYVQLLCNRIFINSNEKSTSEIWRQEAIKIFSEYEYVFYGYRDLLYQATMEFVEINSTRGTGFCHNIKRFCSEI